MKEATNDTLGGILRRARQRRGWSLRNLENATGISHSWLARVELGHYKRPAPHRLTRLAEVLKLDPAELGLAAGSDIAAQLPGARVYFRAKYDLTPSEIAQVEHVLTAIRADRDRTSR